VDLIVDNPNLILTLTQTNPNPNTSDSLQPVTGSAVSNRPNWIC